MERTMSEGRSALSVGGQTDGPTALMGQLRCLYEHRGRSKSFGFKKLFWVVNEAKNCLEVYKNDQVYIPMDIIKAVELRNVTYAADKQNRFYVMVLQLRRSYDVKFRMNSPEERDKWSAAINHLIATFSTTNQRKTALGQVIRHIAIASRQLGIQIAVDTGMILTEIPDDLLQYVLEAVDTALNTIAVITHSGERDVPRHYTLEIRHISDSSEWDQRSTYDPTSRSVLLQVGIYRDMLNHVQFCCTEPDDVLIMMQSSVYRNPTIEGWLDNDPGCVRGRRALVNYISRDRPLIISLQFAQNVRDSTKVEAYLRQFVSEPFFESLITVLQATVEDMVAAVERLRGEEPGGYGGGGASFAPPYTGGAFGSQPLMPKTQSSASFFDMSPAGTASPTRAPTTSGTSAAAAAAAAAVGGSGGSPYGSAAGGLRRSFTMGGGAGVSAPAHTRSRSGGGRDGLNATMLANSGLGGGGAGHSHNRSASMLGIFHRGHNGGAATTSFGVASINMEPASPASNPTARMALTLLLETVDGISVLLEAVRVDSCSGSPTVVLSYSPTYGRKYRSAMLLEAKFSDIFPESSIVPMNTRYTNLKDQFRQLSLRVLLAQLLQTLKIRMNAVCNRKQIRVVFRWGTLFRALREVSAKGEHIDDRSELLRIVASVMNAYESRLLQLVQQLNDMPYSTAELGNASDNSANVFSLFCSCVWCIEVVFAPFSLNELRDPDTPEPPLPTVAGGVMTDTILLVPEDLLGRVAMQLAQRGDNVFGATMRAPSATPATTGSPLLPTVALLPAATKLGKWCASYFRQRENIIPYDITVVRGDIDSDSDDGSDTNGTDGGVDLDFGDAVATERSAENTFLSMQRVVNSVYDQQGPSVDLKISVEDIRQAARSLQRALDNKHRISKHDTEHIMSANLHKLRRMYTTTLDDEVGSRFLTAAESETLLRAFCEYEENEKDIVQKLREAPVSERVQAITGCEPQSLSGNVGQYDFVAIARIALNDLLPLEAVVSRRAWRGGFLFGLTNTGKSLITNCLRGISRPTVATVGLARQVVSFKEWVLALHELGGRDSFRTNWQFYSRRLSKVEFLIFVLDAMNHRAFREAHQYLHEVAKEYPTKPLLIILNNYREHPIPMPLQELLNSISLDKIRKANPDRKVIVCTTDLTIVHSVNRTVPLKLHKGMEQLCEVLRSRSAEDKIPAIPKPDPPSLELEDPPRSAPGSQPTSHHQRLRSSGGAVGGLGAMPRWPSSSASPGSPDRRELLVDGMSGSHSASPLTHDTTKPLFASGQRRAAPGSPSSPPPRLDRSVPERRPAAGAAAAPAARTSVPSNLPARTALAAARTRPHGASATSVSEASTSEKTVQSILRPASSDSRQYPIGMACHGSQSSLGAHSGAATLAWEASHGHAMDTDDDDNDDDVALGAAQDTQRHRHPSETLLSDDTGLNATSQPADPRRRTRVVLSPSDGSPSASSTFLSITSSLLGTPLARTNGGARRTGPRGENTTLPTPAAPGPAMRRSRPQSISITRAPEAFGEHTVSKGLPARRAGSEPQAAAPSSQPRATAVLGRGPSSSGSPLSASRKEPSIRLPLSGDEPLEQSSSYLCTPAPILEERPSLVRQRSATAAPLVSPSPKNHEYKPLHLSGKSHS